MRVYDTSTPNRNFDYFHPGDVIRIGNAPTLDKVEYVKPVDRHILGLDIGKSIDNSALCIMRHTIKPTDKFANDLKKGVSKQCQEERFDIVHLERYPLGEPYPEQIERTKRILGREPLASQNAKLVMDDSGVGRPIGDQFVYAGLRPIRITITAGAEVTQHGGDTWHVPKSVLISNMEARIHTGEFRVAASLTEAGPLKEELLDFERKVSESGRTTWSARVGKHDDIVLACSLACWWAVRTGRATVQHHPDWQTENLRVGGG